ncbi:hypothetical protein DAPPUDRAFT_310779 [Daphnia pulex]|uniref:Uncharacterized protein n=1 Tax=Daphnia pulex TaxID=6669 RepID=E9FVI1_DAPPU|nr:hypothetical protein DAPPUDRAFT_310779 [Daphnia pulex]|eukprot:EFX88556.1 hypothetical protein DAPPUDRAFT_310779 [Daphnia pulex]
MANEQLSIFPSNVQGVEATQAPVREGRSAHPQVFAMMPPFGYYQPQEIQSGFDNDPSLALPYYGSYVQPAAISQPRIFFGALNGLLFPKFVVTKTETVTMVSIVPSTSTLSPTCSTANPGALQCPA